MHSVIQAAPGVWQFLTKSRATADTDMPVCLGASDSSSGSRHPDGSGQRRGQTCRGWWNGYFDQLTGTSELADAIAFHRMTPRRTAYRTISAALWTSSFSRMRARCVSTVLGLMKSSAAMSLFVFPSAMS